MIIHWGDHNPAGDVNPTQEHIYVNDQQEWVDRSLHTRERCITGLKIKYVPLG